MITLTDANGTDVGTFNRSTGALSTDCSEFFHVSADPQDSWSYGIFHNSRFGIFHMYQEKGKFKLELSARGLNTPKFRKCTVTGVSHATNKVLQWLGNIRDVSVFFS